MAVHTFDDFQNFNPHLHRGEQMVRYYGYYSNKCRGQRKKAGRDEIVPAITEPEASFASRKSWVQLIQKIYKILSLTK